MKKDYKLNKLNTLQVNCTAKLFTEIENTYQLLQLVETQERKENKHWVLGAGSNTLFVSDFFDGLIIKINIKGIKTIQETENHIYIQVGAGENWDDFVSYCVTNGLGGIENMIAIPGNVGTSAVSNIGAYGQEASEAIYEVMGLSLESNSILKLNNKECKFGYRKSIFKEELENKFIVTHIVFKLSKIDNDYMFNTEYGDIQKYLEEKNINLNEQKPEEKIGIISSIIKEIRRNKLPDHTKIGTAGSFFKNPEISLPERDSLQKEFPELKAHITPEEKVKLSAGQLIELCGWKGKEVNKIKMSKKHALILINEGKSGYKIKEYAEKVQKSVLKKFGIELSPEVRYCI